MVLGQDSSKAKGLLYSTQSDMCWDHLLASKSLKSFVKRIQHQATAVVSTHNLYHAQKGHILTSLYFLNLELAFF